MWNRVILIFFVLVIAIVFASEPEIPLEEEVANTTFLQKIVLNMEKKFKNCVDLTMNIDNSTDLPSSLNIQAIAMAAEGILIAEISAMPTTIMSEKGIVIPWKCPFVAAAAAAPIGGMLKRLTIIVGETKATALQYNEAMLTMRDEILARVDAHKGKFRACAETCTGSMSCIGSMFCMAWRGFLLLFDVPLGLLQKHVYSGAVSDQKELLDKFKGTVQLNLENDSEYMDGKRKIYEKVAEVEKCMAA